METMTSNCVKLEAVFGEKELRDSLGNKRHDAYLLEFLEIEKRQSSRGPLEKGTRGHLPCAVVLVVLLVAYERNKTAHSYALIRKEWEQYSRSIIYALAIAMKQNNIKLRGSVVNQPMRIELNGHFLRFQFSIKLGSPTVIKLLKN